MRTGSAPILEFYRIARKVKSAGEPGRGGAGQILGRSTRCSGTGQLQRHKMLG